MARSKQAPKKQKRGVDFNKIKRKIGKKLPPPRNATDTNVKSKAIILPEQSVASERAGLAVSKKGLTLKELLQQTSHHNAKVRNDALLGIKDLALKYPAELRLHKLAIIEKLRERISDEDKLVRETLYQLLKSVIFPGSKEDIPGPIISLIMGYVFNAMTHLALDIRLMAFKFFDLVVLHFPSSFLLYAEKVLYNYEDILRNSQIYLQDKSKLRTALDGLVRCLSLLASDGTKVETSSEQTTNMHGALHAFESELPKEHIGVSSVIKKLEDILPILVNCFQEFVPSVRVISTVESQSFDCMRCLLEGISLAVKSFIHGMNKPMGFELHTPSLYKGSDLMRARNFLFVSLKKLFEVFPLKPVNRSTKKDDEKYFVLNVGITEIFLPLTELIGAPPVLMEKFAEFLENVLSGQICSNSRSNRVLLEKHLVSLLPFIPRVISRMSTNWISRLLKAFTIAFESCKPESALNLACMSVMEAILLPRQDEVFLDTSGPDMLTYQVAWIRKLPELLLQLGDRHPSDSKVVLHLQLRLGQCIPMNSVLAVEYENMQCQLRNFYSTYLDDGGIQNGPFLQLPRDCQELAICSLYYFSSLDTKLLESLACCCLCHDLEPHTLFRVIEVLHSAYRSGHIQIADHISFLVTLLGHFKVFPEKHFSSTETEGNISNCGTFKAITKAVCSCLTQMGDDTLVLKILLRTVLNEMSLRPPVDNMCAMLRVFVVLDSERLVLSEQNIDTLSTFLLRYLNDAAVYIPDNDDGTEDSEWLRICHYYVQPAIFLLARSDKLLRLVLDLLGSSITRSDSTCTSNNGVQEAFTLSKVHTITSIVVFLHKDAKLHRSLSLCKEAIKRILQNVLSLQVSVGNSATLQEAHQIQYSFDRMKTETGRLHLWNANDLKGISEVR